jgi:hypothetical protein
MTIIGMPFAKISTRGRTAVIKRLPEAILATTKLMADLDQIVASLGHQDTSWLRSRLKKDQVEKLSQNPGVYCVILPKSALPKNRTLILHGRTFGRRNARRQLQILYSYEPKAVISGSKDMIVYVGKAANIRARIKGHRSTNPGATTNQVLRGLIGKPKTQVTEKLLQCAKECLENHGSIYYVDHFHENELSDCRASDNAGECLVAERDLLEIKVIAAYAPPFNIKAER